MSETDDSDLPDDGASSDESAASTESDLTVDDRAVNDARAEEDEAGAEGDESGAEMPFLDHLEELRWRILKALGAILVGAIIAFVFVDDLFGILTHPYEDAVRSMLYTGDAGPGDAIASLVERWLGTAADGDPGAVADPDALLPLGRQLQFIKPLTAFLVRLQIALLAGLVLALPVVFFQFWKFVAPGLLTSEIRIFLPVIGLSVLCFLIGALIAYWIVLPLGIRFFLGLEAPGMTSQWAVNEYISFVLKLILGFGIVFEMPVVSLFLSRLGILTPEYLRRIRRYAVVAIFLMAAIFTPPDPISQLLMALPLLVLYEISIWVSRVSGNRRQPQA